MTEEEYLIALAELESESQSDQEPPKRKRGRKVGQRKYSPGIILNADTNPPKTNIAGQRFGRLTVTNNYQRKPDRRGFLRIYWLCQCDCGKTKWLQDSALRNNITFSCGCLRKETSQFNLPNVQLANKRYQEQLNSLSWQPLKNQN